MRACFVTGTDTGIGKTWVTLGLMAAFRQAGLRVAGMKPVASGCIETEAGLRNEDALHIAAACSETLPYSELNPYAFAAPIAPHIAAAETGTRIEMETILAAYTRIQEQAEATVVEGAGGWRVPLGENTSMKDLVQCLDIPVLLVVGLKLGCINHALLSAEAILNDGVKLLGWVANQVDPGYETTVDSIRHLKANIPGPLLGHVPFMATLHAEEIAAHLSAPPADG